MFLELRHLTQICVQATVVRSRRQSSRPSRVSKMTAYAISRGACSGRAVVSRGAIAKDAALNAEDDALRRTALLRGPNCTQGETLIVAGR